MLTLEHRIWASRSGIGSVWALRCIELGNNEEMLLHVFGFVKNRQHFYVLFACLQMQLQPWQVEEAMNCVTTKVGRDGKVPWQQVSEHFIHRWRFQNALVDFKSSKEGKVLAVRVADLLRTCYRTLKVC